MFIVHCDHSPLSSHCYIATEMDEQSTICFPENESPDIYIETPDKVCRNDVFKHCGILGSKWKTRSVLRFEQGRKGIYCAWDLKVRNHAQVHRVQRAQISVFAKKKRGKQIQHITSSKDFIDIGNLVVFQGHSKRYDKLSVDKLDLLGDVVSKLLDKYKKQEVDQRGNIQIGGGFAAENHKLVGDITVPQVTLSVDKWLVQKMVIMTSIIKEISNQFENWKPFSNSKRIDKFANSLPGKFGIEGENIIEHMVFALTAVDKSSDELLFLNHVDQFNCPVWKEVFCCWNHFYDSSRQKWFRVVALAYARACVLYTMNRQHARDTLYNKVIAYVTNSEDSRKRLEGSADLVGDGQKVALVLPKFPKGSFYGCFVTSIRKLVLKHQLSLERFSELLLVCGWVTTGMNLCPLYDSWENMLPTNNLAVAALEEMFAKHGGLLKGKGQRFQPSLNFSLLEKDVVNASRKLATILSQIREGNTNYVTAWKDMQEITGYRGLAAQHCLAIAALCGFIDPSFATAGIVSPRTNTYKKIVEIYNLHDAVIGQLTKDIAQALSMEEETVENIFCECFREIDHNLPYDQEMHHAELLKRRLKRGQGYNHPDVVFVNQSFFEILKQEVIEVLPDGTRQVAPDIHVYNDPVYKGGCTNPMKVLKVSAESRLRTDDCNKKEKRTKKSENRHHSGFGKRPSELKEKRILFPDEDSSDCLFRCSLNEREKLAIARVRVRTRSGNSSSRQPLSYGEIVTATKEDGTYSIIDVFGTIKRMLHTDRSGAYSPPKKRKRNVQWIQFMTKTVTEDDFQQPIYTCRMNGSYDCSFLSVHNGSGLVSFDGFYGYHSDGLAYYYSKEKAQKACIINALVHIASKRKVGEIPTWYERKLPSDHKNSKSRDHVVLVEKLSHNKNDHRVFGVLFFCLDQRVLTIPADPMALDSTQWYSYRIPN